MRPSRRSTISSGSKYPLLVANQFRMDIPPLTLEGREVVRKYLNESAHAHDLEILAWCIQPTSYRIILRTPAGFSSRKNEQNTPLVKFSKAFQMRISGWVNYCAKQYGSIWAHRYQASSLDTPGERIAAAVSVDAFPVFANIVDTADEYFFTSYYHACAGDTVARQGISKLMGTPDAPWSQVKRRYAKLLKQPA
jgi:hypothetical protein